MKPHHQHFSNNALRRMRSQLAAVCHQIDDSIEFGVKQEPSQYETTKMIIIMYNAVVR